MWQVKTTPLAIIRGLVTTKRTTEGIARELTAQVANAANVMEDVPEEPI
jgi:hypothetical protein